MRIRTANNVMRMTAVLQLKKVAPQPIFLPVEEGMREDPQPARNIGIMEKKMETTIEYRGYIGVMENKMETTIEYWGYMGIMENRMETTVVK